MSDSTPDALSAFVERVVRQLEKNGFPEHRVSFSIERMYEAAAAKGVSFNKVLDALAQRGIDHEKTPEKIIFSPPSAERASDAGDFAGLDPGALAGLDPSVLAGMPKEQLLAAAQAAMQQMDPAQLMAIRTMLESMTPEQRAAMLEQARKLGLG